MNVLVVDDNADAAELLAWRMKARGIAAAAVGSVRQAIAVLALTPVDLVLTDYCMPREDGLALAAFCARSHPDLPVVVVTGWSRHEISRRAACAAVFDLIQKPVSDPDLDRVLARFDDRVALNRDVANAAALADSPCVPEVGQQLLA